MTTETVWKLYVAGVVSVFSLDRFSAIQLAGRVAKQQGLPAILRSADEEIRVRPNGLIRVLGEVS